MSVQLYTEQTTIYVTTYIMHELKAAGVQTMISLNQQENLKRSLQEEMSGRLKLLFRDIGKRCGPQSVDKYLISLARSMMPVCFCYKYELDISVAAA